MSLLPLAAGALPVAAVTLAPVGSRQWECVAAAGNGRHSDAHEADAPARQLQRAAQLTADSYRFAGQPGAGGGSVGSGGHAPALRARAAEIAEKPRSGVVLRVAVLGGELAGPERGAPVRVGRARGGTGARGAMRLWPETAAVRAGQDGPASRPLPGRAPWSPRPEVPSSSAVAVAAVVAAGAAAAERSGRRAAGRPRGTGE
ncbi:hypothetical protein [Streptomyces sp. S063]|uniref:hypothetical protein n=1 Tax=Streptomyces sp. S063 TaxID=2005885 RepID=UPI0010082313|nr:hypothetical protein [Streptomyces sp. S063]